MSHSEGPNMTVLCPCCEQPMEVRFMAGTPARFYPNDKAHPAEPPEVDFPYGDDPCQCFFFICSAYRRVLVDDEGDEREYSYTSLEDIYMDDLLSRCIDYANEHHEPHY